MDRSFLRQLLCCLRPAQTHIYNNTNCINQKNTNRRATTTDQHHQTIIASVERPSQSPSSQQSQTTTTTTTASTTSPPIPTKAKQPSNNDSPNQLSPSNNNNHASTDAVIISQLQQLQSPTPNHGTEREQRYIAQSNNIKTRNRSFLSQLLRCFRPTPSHIYHNSECIYKNPEGRTIDQQLDSLTQKYSGKYLLPAKKPSDNRICLVIDLDETLVHSSFKPIDNADFIVPVEIDGTLHKVYVSKRPHVDEFLKKMGQLYECVLFTASLAKYADPVADLLDTANIFKARLFRESCAFYRGNYVKDLSRLGRDLERVIIVDNSPASYMFHPDNAVSIKLHV